MAGPGGASGQNARRRQTRRPSGSARSCPAGDSSHGRSARRCSVRRAQPACACRLLPPYVEYSDSVTTFRRVADRLLCCVHRMRTTSDQPKPQKYAAPRGTADVLPDDWPWWKHVRDTAERVCALFGYRRIETPVFEHAGVFLRSVGAGTDIVEKEVYLFDDRGGDRLALRPEGTGAIARAYVQHGMASWPQPVRLFYIVQNFRYDRPQAGRYRQHTQFGAEAIGDAGPLIDAEIIDLVWTFYRELGLRDLVLKLNTIGDENCRPRYIEALRDYYRPLLDKVCADDRVRFEKNPMRLLD